MGAPPYRHTVGPLPVETVKVYERSLFRLAVDRIPVNSPITPTVREVFSRPHAERDPVGRRGRKQERGNTRRGEEQDEAPPRKGFGQTFHRGKNLTKIQGRGSQRLPENPTTTVVTANLLKPVLIAS